MPEKLITFTPAEIADARENPRLGDRWEDPERGALLYVGDIDPDGSVAGSVLIATADSAEVRGFHWQSGRFQNWTRNVTLIRRGV